MSRRLSAPRLSPLRRLSLCSAASPSGRIINRDPTLKSPTRFVRQSLNHQTERRYLESNIVLNPNDEIEHDLIHLTSPIRRFWQVIGIRLSCLCHCSEICLTTCRKQGETTKYRLGLEGYSTCFPNRRMKSRKCLQGFPTSRGRWRKQWTRFKGFNKLPAPFLNGILSSSRRIRCF